MNPDEPSREGVLYVVATPIGNLGDMTPRAIETLRSVDRILTEDTRTFGRLAQAFSISTPYESYHDHNEVAQTAKIIPRLQAGQRIALVSEAGTPGISDPGYRIIKACAEASIKVVPVPGASAFLAALAASGFEIHEFNFRGFPPLKSGKRATFVREVLGNRVTTVLYESPHRIVKLISAIVEVEPSRQLCVARELTKKYEELLRGTAEEIYANLANRREIRGEFVVVIRGIASVENATSPDQG